MKYHSIVTVFLAITGVVMLIAITGCNPPSETDSFVKPIPPQDKSPAKKPTTDDHGHKPSAHGGVLVPIGTDSYHAEAVFEKNGGLRLYMLGKDESKVIDVETQELSAYAKVVDSAEAEPFALNPVPQPGDAKGRTSLFIGSLPASVRGKAVSITIPSIRIGGERFRVGFQSAQEDPNHVEMPVPVVGDDERKLFLTPGGIYTAADIKANGDTAASIKFKGLKPTHDVAPKEGDVLCPISMTKANPKFTWIIAGKTYQFCCPPCVDEFVALAKEHSEQIREPEFYIKRKN